MDGQSLLYEHQGMVVVGFSHFSWLSFSGLAQQERRAQKTTPYTHRSLFSNLARLRMPCPIWRKILSRESNIAFGSRVWQEGEEEEAKCLLFFSVQLTLLAEILCSPLSVCTDGG